MPSVLKISTIGAFQRSAQKQIYDGLCPEIYIKTKKRPQNRSENRSQRIDLTGLRPEREQHFYASLPPDSVHPPVRLRGHTLTHTFRCCLSTPRCFSRASPCAGEVHVAAELLRGGQVRHVLVGLCVPSQRSCWRLGPGIRLNEIRHYAGIVMC